MSEQTRPPTGGDDEWFHVDTNDGDGWRVLAVTGTGRWAGSHIMARCDREDDAYRITRALNVTTPEQPLRTEGE